MDLRFAGLRSTRAARIRLVLLLGLGLLLIVPASADGQDTGDDCDPAVAERDPACAVRAPGQPPTLESETPVVPGPDAGTPLGGPAAAPARENARPEPGGLLPTDERGVQPGRSERPADPARR